MYVVDDDPSVCRGLSRLLRSGGYAVETFSSATEFLESDHTSPVPACVILDVQLPGLTGPELQQKLHAAGSTLGIIFISAHGDIPMTVQAMKYGAVDFLPKPFDGEMLLKSVAQAIGKTVWAQQRWNEVLSIQRRLDTLTPREREVMELIVTGKLNKQVADELGTVEKTIKVHRARVIEKMQVESLAELVQLSERMKRPSR